MSNSEKLLKKAFEVLNREGKKLMLDDLCISIAKHVDTKSCKFIEFLQYNNKLDNELIIRIYKNIDVINHYLKFPNNNRPDIISRIEYIDEENERLFKEIDRSNDIRNKIKMIKSIMQEFISEGSYESYLLLRIIQVNYCHTRGILATTTKNIVKRSVNKRYKLL